MESQTIPINEYNSAIAWLEKQGKLPVSDIDEQMISKIKFAVYQMSSERQDTKKECLNWLEDLRERL